MTALALALHLTLSAKLDVAVLYFDNDTGNASLDVMKKGMADMLITDLGTLEALQVVERDRLEQVIGELKLQRSKYFDKSTAQKVGKLVGATHAVTGSLVAVAPQLRVDIRLIEVKTGKVLVTSQATGAQDDVFGLEQQLVSKFVTALDAKLTPPETRTGKVTVGGLLKFSQGLDEADRGDLKAARTTLGEVVRDSPDFSLAQLKYAEVLKRLREAEKKREVGQSDSETALVRQIELWRAKKLTQVPGPELGTYFAYLFAGANLELHRIAKLAGATKATDEHLWVPPSKLAALTALEKKWLDACERLIVDLTAYRRFGVARQLRTELSDVDTALSKDVAGIDLAVWSFASASRMSLDVAEYLSTGRTPYHVELPQLFIRPSPLQRDGSLAKKVDALFAEAQKGFPLDDQYEVVSLEAQLQDARAERFVVLGKSEAAAAQWQAFLDANPKAEEFELLSKKLQNQLLISDEVERAQKQVDACDGSVDGLKLARRTASAEGITGVDKLSRRMLACAKKDKRWEKDAFALPARAALAMANCPLFLEVRRRAAAAGQPLSAVELGKHACDDP